eukprot:gene38188-47148_t
MAEENAEVLASLGLDIANLFGSQGKICAEKFDEVLTALESETVNVPTKAKIAENLSILSTGDDDSIADQKDYKGKVFNASKICGMLQTAERVEVIKTLIKTIPYSGTVNIPNGIQVLTSILTSEGAPAELKTDAKTVFSQMSNVNKANVEKSGKEIMDLILLAEVLVPHLEYFLTHLSSPMGSLVLMIIDFIAVVDPALVFKHIAVIGTNSANVASGKIAFAVIPDVHAADVSFNLLLTLLEKKNIESTVVAVVLSEISNIMASLSDKQVLIAALPKLVKHRGASEVTYGAIDDFACGRSLSILSDKVSELDKKVNQLNNKVAETCSNLSDVIAYVDANMADMKDFLAEVVKKLPTPKRLQID